jgi:uncharacterized protein YjiS (DUF1127 family)
MSTTFHNVPRPHRLRWRQYKRLLGAWRSRCQSRRELMGLSDRYLDDIGITRSSAGYQASKLFWLP